MAITHADLAPKTRTLNSKRSVFLIVLTIISGLFCFILCIFAEVSRSEVRWTSSRNESKETTYECAYNGNGKMPLLCAAIAFIGLAIAMMIEHTYVLIAVSQTPPPALISWEFDSKSAQKLIKQGGFLFLSTWVSFAISEILLLIGVIVESGHLRNWGTPRPSCLIIQQGLFSAAGILALLTVFLGAGMYITALKLQKEFEQLQNVQRRVMEMSELYTSPPRTPRNGNGMTIASRENPIVDENQNHQSSISYHLALLNKAYV